MGGGHRRGGRSSYGGGYYGPTQREIAAKEREQRRLEKESEIEGVDKAERALVAAHLEAFAIATPPKAPEVKPVAPGPIRQELEAKAGIPKLEAAVGGGKEKPVAPEMEPIDRAALQKQFRQEALKDISRFRRGERRAATEAADAQAEQAAKAEEGKRAAEREAKQQELDRDWAVLEEKRAEVARALELEVAKQDKAREKERQGRQVELDADWERLDGNDPATVMATLEAAFADNRAPAAPIDCDGSEVTVTMKFRGPEIVPERYGAYTPTGKPTLKKRPKSDVNSLYLQSMASHVLATVKEALAVAPGIETVSVLVLREETKGKPPGLVGATYAGQFTRAKHPPGRGWREVDVVRAIEEAPGSLLNLKGAAAEVSPLDLRDEPDLQEVLERVAQDLHLVPVSAGSNMAKTSAHAKKRAKPAEEALAEIDKMSDPQERWDALWSLRERRLNLSMIKPLAKLATGDPDRHVRGEAIDLLADIGDPKVADALVGLAKDPDPSLRERAINGLERVAAKDHGQLFVEAASDPDPHVRQSAVRALETSGSDQAFAAIAGAIEDSDPSVRFYAAIALRNRTDPASRAALETARNDPDPDVREIAADTNRAGISVTTRVTLAD